MAGSSCGRSCSYSGVRGGLAEPCVLWVSHIRPTRPAPLLLQPRAPLGAAPRLRRALAFSSLGCVQPRLRAAAALSPELEVTARRISPAAPSPEPVVTARRIYPTAPRATKRRHQRRAPQSEGSEAGRLPEGRQAKRYPTVQQRRQQTANQNQNAVPGVASSPKASAVPGYGPTGDRASDRRRDGPTSTQALSARQSAIPSKQPKRIQDAKRSTSAAERFLSTSPAAQAECNSANRASRRSFAPPARRPSRG